jgi:DNA transformation protein and related proteins
MSAAHTAAVLQDALAGFGSITVRRMFGGAGVYCDGVIFALVVQDIIYFKADAGSIPAFEAEGMGPFTYQTKRGQRGLSSYWQIPDRLLDEPDELATWAVASIAVSKAAKPARAIARSTSNAVRKHR